MTTELARFEALVETYGASPEHWPEGERDWARAFAETSPFARQALARAAELDALLDGLEVEAPSPQLMQKVLASAPAFRQARPETPKVKSSPRARSNGMMAGLNSLIGGADLMPLLRPTPWLAAAAMCGVTVGWFANPAAVPFEETGVPYAASTPAHEAAPAAAPTVMPAPAHMAARSAAPAQTAEADLVFNEDLFIEIAFGTGAPALGSELDGGDGR